MQELFEEYLYTDPPMFVPILKSQNGEFPSVEGYKEVYPKFQIRRDYFTREWCIINASRADRPKAFKCNTETIGHDFLDPERYRHTPKDIARYNGMPPQEILSRLMSDDELNEQGDIHRETDKNGNVAPREVLNISPFLRYHGVMIDDPVCVNGDEWDPDAFLRGLEWTSERTKQLTDLGYKTVIIRNHGVESGASQPRPHQQQGGLPIRTNRMEREIEVAHRFYQRHTISLYDAVISAELQQGKRVIIETNHTIAFTPFAPTIGTREVRILLKQPCLTLYHLLEEKARFNDFGYLIVEIVNAILKSGVGSFNYSIRQDTDPIYRLNFVIAPSQNYGEMERGEKTLVVEELPEVSAQVLRDHL